MCYNRLSVLLRWPHFKRRFVRLGRLINETISELKHPYYNTFITCCANIFDSSVIVYICERLSYRFVLMCLLRHISTKRLKLSLSRMIYYFVFYVVIVSSYRLACLPFPSCSVLEFFDGWQILIHVLHYIVLQNTKYITKYKIHFGKWNQFPTKQ